MRKIVLKPVDFRKLRLFSEMQNIVLMHREDLKGFERSLYNRIVPVWNSLPSNVRHITNYPFFISSLKRLLFEKMNTSFVSSDCFSCFFLIFVL